MSTKILMISPECDGEDIGETWNAFHWVTRLSKFCDVTLLTMRRPNHTPPSRQLPGVRVVEWDEFPAFAQFPKMTGAVKPWYPSFYTHARNWIRAALAEGERFDLIHQLTPLAMRFPSPAVGMGLPFIIGPLAGSLATPPGFATELGSAPFYMHLRRLDALRMNYDPWLRATYQQADIVLCSSPYVREILAPLEPKRCEVFCEVGIDPIAKSLAAKTRKSGELRLLHVGRAVRTKGLRDAVHAMAQIKDLGGVTLDVAGGGEELEICRREAAQLGIADRIHFHGRLPRGQIDALYAQSDVFLFPSFREPTGIVLFEAMSYGLPVITTDRGGPGYIVDDTCGIRISPVEPVQFARDLAGAIRGMANDEGLVERLGDGALARTAAIGHWDGKLRQMLDYYDSLLD